MTSTRHSTAYDQITAAQLHQRGTSKWTRYGSDVLGAWVAEMDFTVAPPIKAALQAAIDCDCFGYAPGDEHTGLTAATAAFHRRNGLNVESNQIFVMPDVLKALELGIDAFSPPGSAVVVLTPAYPPFFSVAQLLERPVVEVPMHNDRGYHTLDLDGIDRAFASGAKTLILCNPHNPLGRLFSRQELSALAAVVHKHGARVVTDEVHGPLTMPGETFTPYATASAEAAGHSVTLTSASKGWNVAGLKCAQLTVTNPDDIATWKRVPGLRSHGASILGIIANRVAYEQGWDWLEDTLAYLDGNRRALENLLRAYLPQVVYWKPQGTYLSWLDCRQLGLDNPGEFFLEHAKVAVNDGSHFGEPGKGFVRLNFATSAAILGQIVKQMGQAVAAR